MLKTYPKGDRTSTTLISSPVPPQRLNGRVERRHRIDTEEVDRLLDGAVIDDADLFKAPLKEGGDLRQLRPAP